MKRHYFLLALSVFTLKMYCMDNWLDNVVIHNGWLTYGPYADYRASNFPMQSYSSSANVHSQTNSVKPKDKANIEFKPIVLSLQAQALAFIAQSSSTNDELAAGMPKDFLEKIILLRKILARLEIQLITDNNSESALLIQALLSGVKNTYQKKLVVRIFNIASQIGAIEPFIFFMKNGTRLTPQNLNCYLCNLCKTSKDISDETQVKFARFMLDNGAYINAQDRYGYTALGYAARHGKLALAEYLLQRGADVHGQSFYVTPLFNMFWYINVLGDKAILMTELLLKYGADTERLIPHHNRMITITQYLIDQANENYNLIEIVFPIVDLIKKHQKLLHEKKEQEFLIAAHTGNIEALKRLLGENVKALCVDSNNNNALMLAAQTGRFDTVKFLLDTIKDKRLTRQGNKHLQNAEQLAESIGDMRIVRLIQENM